jgi:hypothetical protein
MGNIENTFTLPEAEPPKPFNLLTQVQIAIVTAKRWQDLTHEEKAMEGQQFIDSRRIVFGESTSQTGSLLRKATQLASYLEEHDTARASPQEAARTIRDLVAEVQRLMGAA